jgi:hypothetical protein
MFWIAEAFTSLAGARPAIFDARDSSLVERRGGFGVSSLANCFFVEKG